MLLILHSLILSFVCILGSPPQASQAAAGNYLAKRLHCEAAIVTAGAAWALILGTAVCITIMHPASATKLPTNLTGLKNEVIIHKPHRCDYDHALRNCKTHHVEIETSVDNEAALNKSTVTAHFFSAAESGRISLQDWVRIADNHVIPCFNQAAADVPSISDLWNYTNKGFDLVAFSGAKGIRGPQNAGFLLGRRELIAAATMKIIRFPTPWPAA